MGNSGEMTFCQCELCEEIKKIVKNRKDLEKERADEHRANHNDVRT